MYLEALEAIWSHLKTIEKKVENAFFSCFYSLSLERNGFVSTCHFPFRASFIEKTSYAKVYARMRTPPPPLNGNPIRYVLLTPHNDLSCADNL